MEFRGGLLFRLDIGCPNYLAPLLGIFSDELPEVGEPRLCFGIGERRVDLFVERVDDFAWRASRCADTRECARLETWHGIPNEWNVWNWIQAGWAPPRRVPRRNFACR